MEDRKDVRVDISPSFKRCKKIYVQNMYKRCTICTFHVQKDAKDAKSVRLARKIKR